MKAKRCITAILLAAALCAVLAWALLGDPRMLWREKALQRALRALPESQTQVTLNDVVPFAWDAVYTFDPYTDRATMEAEMGVTSRAIEETVSEGMVQLLFVKNGKLVASVCGYPQNLGYSVEFSRCVRAEEHVVFAVHHTDGLVRLVQE